MNIIKRENDSIDKFEEQMTDKRSQEKALKRKQQLKEHNMNKVTKDNNLIEGLL